MTRQTAAPLEHHSLNPSARQAREVVRTVLDGQTLLDPPYQRGSVWTEDQRVALIESWLRGLPAGVIILADRGTELWRQSTGDDPYREGRGLWAVIDGKQRLTTAIRWFNGELAVPSSWFPADQVETTEDTDDGPYVRYTGLTLAGQRIFTNRALFMIAETKSCATVADEARFYLLVNGGGTAQTGDDMANAARVAGAIPSREVVAYTLGSFWFCQPCARTREERETLVPTRRADLMGVYKYVCDQCGKTIA
jgi:hypothetical protein